LPASLLLMKGIGTNAGNYVNTSHDFTFTTLDSANIAANVAPLGTLYNENCAYHYSYDES